LTGGAKCAPEGRVLMHKRVHQRLVQVHGVQLVQERLLRITARVAQRFHGLLPRQLRGLLEALDVRLREGSLQVAQGQPQRR